MCFQWALLTDDLATKINLNYRRNVFPSAVYSYLCKNASGGLCVSFRATLFLNLYCGKRGSSTDCILNVVAQQKEAFSLDLAESIVLRRARPTSSRHKELLWKTFLLLIIICVSAIVCTNVGVVCKITCYSYFLLYSICVCACVCGSSSVHIPTFACLHAFSHRI